MKKKALIKLFVLMLLVGLAPIKVYAVNDSALSGIDFKSITDNLQNYEQVEIDDGKKELDIPMPEVDLEYEPLLPKSISQSDILPLKPKSLIDIETVVSVEYDDKGRQIQGYDVEGELIVRYQYNSKNQVIKVMDANGIESGNSDDARYGAVYKYTSKGEIREYRRPLKIEEGKVFYSVIRFLYNSKGLLSKVQESDEYVTLTSSPKKKKVTEYEYDRQGNVTLVKDTTGKHLEYRYNENGQLIQQREKVEDDVFNTTIFQYDSSTGLLRSRQTILDEEFLVEDVNSGTALTRFKYDEQDRVKELIYPSGESISYLYDSLGNVTKKTQYREVSSLQYKKNKIYIDSLNLEAYEGQEYTYLLKLDMEDEIRFLDAEISYDPETVEIVSLEPLQEQMVIDVYSSQTFRVSGSIDNRNLPLITIKFKVKSNIKGSTYFVFNTLPQFEVDGETKEFTEAVGKSVVIKSPDFNHDMLVGANDFTLGAVENGMTREDPNFNIEYDINSDGVIDRKDLDYIKEWIFDEKEASIRTYTPSYFNPRLYKEEYSLQSEIVKEEMSFAYNQEGLLTSIQDLEGRKYLYDYDENNNLVKATDSVGNTSIYVYDGNNRLIQRTTPEGVAHKYVYNAKGQLVKHINKDTVKNYSYDAIGNVTKAVITSAVSERGYEELSGYIYSYDLGNRVLSVQSLEQEKENAYVSYKYDAHGRIVLIRDALNNKTSIERDLNGRVLLVKDPLGEQISYEYNVGGLLSSYINQLKGTYTFNYNNLGELSKLSNPLSGSTYYKYDRAGRVGKRIYPNATIIKCEYNLNGLLVKETNGKSGEKITRTYDVKGNLSSVILPEDIITYAYYPNNLLKLIYHNKDLFMSVTYNRDGQVASIMDNKMHTTYYGYDMQGRLDDVSTLDQGIVKYTYDEAGNVIMMSYADGSLVKFEYDKDQNMKKSYNYHLASGEESNIYTYEYDLNGNAVEVNSLKGFTRNKYDALNRLVKIVEDEKVTEIEYNPLSSIKTIINDTDEIIYSYNMLGQPKSFSKNGDVTLYSYNKSGQKLSDQNSDGKSIYSYNDFGQLSAIFKPDGSWEEYNYDDVNNMIRRFSNGIQETYFYSKANNLTIMNENFVMSSRQILGLDAQLVAKQYRNGKYYRLRDLQKQDTNILDHYKFLADLFTPKNLNVSNVNVNTQLLEWDNVNSADYYEIKVNNERIVSANDRSKLLLNLLSGSWYTYKIRSIKGESIGYPWSRPYTLKTLSDFPREVDRNSEMGSITLDWEDVRGVTKYEIEVMNEVITTTSSVFKHVNLSPNTQYSYKIRSLNESGEGPWSPPIVHKTLPKGIDNILSEVSANQVIFSWDRISGVESYEIELDGGLQVITENSLVINDLTPDSSFTFRARGISSVGKTEWSEYLVGKTLLPTVTGINVINDERGRVIEWSQISGATYYEVQTNRGLEVVEGNQLIQNNIPPNTTDTFKVRAMKEDNFGNWSMSFKSITPPTTPENIEIKSTRDEIRMNWSHTEGASGYQLNVNGREFEISATNSYILNNLIESYYRFKIRSKNSGGYSAWSQEFIIDRKLAKPSNVDRILGSNNISLSWSSIQGAAQYEILVDGVSSIIDEARFNHENLLPYTTHVYRVRAINGNNMSEWSEPLVATTLVGVTTSIATPTVTSNMIKVEWLPVEGAEGYQLSINGQSQTLGNVLSFNHTTLVPNTSYTYKVRAYNGDGYGQWSQVVVQQPAPITPKNVQIDTQTKEITLSWDQISGVSNYEIEVDGEVKNVVDNSFRHEKLQPNKNHSYRIRAVGSTGLKGAYTELFKVKTRSEVKAPIGQDTIFNFIIVVPPKTDSRVRYIDVYYDESEMEILDYCATTPKIDTELGKIENTNMTIVIKGDGYVRYMIENVDQTYTTTIQFKSLSQQKQGIHYEIY